MSTINVTVGSVKFGLDEFHPAIDAAITAMKRNPNSVRVAMLAEVNEYVEANEGSEAVKETGGKGKVSYTETKKGQSVTVSGSAGRKVKMPATGASTLLALNERLEAVREMFCRVDAVELPAGIRNWIRENVAAQETVAESAPAA